MKNENEEWIAIEGALGYSINQNGQVRGKRGQNLSILTGNLGYKMVIFTLKEFGDSGKMVRRSAYVHRLLAEAFLVKPTEGERFVVSHINGDVTDNRLENLEWREYFAHLAVQLQNAQKAKLAKAEERRNAKN